MLLSTVNIQRPLILFYARLDGVSAPPGLVLERGTVCGYNPFELNLSAADLGIYFCSLPLLCFTGLARRGLETPGKSLR